MGNFFCLSNSNLPQLTAVARNVCPFPDYSPGTLLNNMLSVNSSLHLSEHYAAVQASLTPQQQQDFTQNLRSTFGQEGKVSNGAVPIVALSLAIFFETVASRVKGKYVSDQEPIPGLFIRDPTGTYSAPVYTVSKYLRLVPHIANNPTRMKEETEKYLLELKRTGILVMDKFYAAGEYEDVTALNLCKCIFIGKKMEHHLSKIFNKTIELVDSPRSKNFDNLKPILSVNCDPSFSSQRVCSMKDSLDDESKNIDLWRDGMNRTFIEFVVWMSLSENMTEMMKSAQESVEVETGDFDLKTNALAKWT